MVAHPVDYVCHRVPIVLDVVVHPPQVAVLGRLGVGRRVLDGLEHLRQPGERQRISRRREAGLGAVRSVAAPVGSVLV